MIRPAAGTLRPGRTTAALVALLLVSAGAAATTAPASGAWTARITNSASTASAAKHFDCAGTLGEDTSTALFQWPLNETDGADRAIDISGRGNQGVYQGTPVHTAVDAAASGSPWACLRDGSTAWALDGTSSFAYFPNTTAGVPAPVRCALEIWFRTSNPQGKLIGIGDSQTAGSTTHDRNLYVDLDGYLRFGTYASDPATTVRSLAPVTDGKWHHAVASMSAEGMALFVDGTRAEINTGVTSGQNIQKGYWHVGWDRISGRWPRANTANQYFRGQIRFAAVYGSTTGGPALLSPTQILQHYNAGT